MSKLELTLYRVWCLDKYTIGKLYVNGKYLCDTLEDPVRDINQNGKFDNGEIKIYGDTAIPFGKYDVELTMSPKFKRLLPLLLNVNEFSGIRIHAGNSVKDTLGCILPGENKEKGKVLNSKHYENLIVDLFKENNNVGTIDIVFGLPK